MNSLKDKYLLGGKTKTEVYSIETKKKYFTGVNVERVEVEESRNPWSLGGAAGGGEFGGTLGSEGERIL